MERGTSDAVVVAELALPALLGDLWESVLEMSKMKKVETSFYRHFQECSKAYPFRSDEDWQSVVSTFRDVRGFMKSAVNDLRLAEKDKDEILRFSVKKMLDLHVFYGWQLRITVMLDRGHAELEHVVASIIEVVQVTSQMENPPLRTIQEGIRAVSEGEQHFKVGLIWSQVCKGYMIETLNQHWEQEFGRPGRVASEMTWDVFVEEKVHMNRKTAWRYRRLYWLCHDYPVRCFFHLFPIKCPSISHISPPYRE